MRIIKLITAAAALLCATATIGLAKVAEYDITQNLLYDIPIENVTISAGTIGGFGQRIDVLFDGAFNVSGNAGTRWAVESGMLGASIEFEFEKFVTVDRMLIKNGYPGEGEEGKQRLLAFSMWYWDGAEYKKINFINNNSPLSDTHTFNFDAVTTNKIKIVSEQNAIFRMVEIVMLSPGSEYVEGTYEYTPKKKIEVKYNNAFLTFDKDKPEADKNSGVMFVPVREMRKHIDFTAEWIDSEKQIVIGNENHKGIFTIGKNVGIIDGKEVTLSGIPYLRESRAYLPVRDFAKAVGGCATWYDYEREIDIISEEFIPNLAKSYIGESAFSVVAGGKEKVVYRTANCDFVQAVSDDVIDFEITYNGKITSAVLKPFSKGIKPEVTGNTVKFSAKSRDQLCLIINGDKKCPLFISVNPEIARPEDDGNTLYFEDEKVYRPGIVQLSDNQTVYIGENVVIDGGFAASGKKNIKIIGHGVIKNLSKNSLIGMDNCEDVTINGLTVIGAQAWHNPWNHCNNVLAENYKIFGSETYSDGIDMVSCNNVTLRNIMLRNEDDGLCIKLSGDKGSENILAENCVIWSGEQGNSTEIGYELVGPYVRNVTFRNIDVINRGTRSAKFRRSAMSIHNAGYAKVHDILYDNIRVEETDENLIHMERISYSEWGVCEGSIEDIKIENVTYLDDKIVPINMINEAQVEGKHSVSFKNFTYGGKKLDSMDALKANGLVVSGDVEIGFHE